MAFPRLYASNDSLYTRFQREVFAAYQEKREPDRLENACPGARLFPNALSRCRRRLLVTGRFEVTSFLFCRVRFGLGLVLHFHSETAECKVAGAAGCN